MCEDRVGIAPNTEVLGVLEDVIGKLRKGAITLDEFKKFVKRENPFSENPNQYRGLVKSWRSFYKKVFGEVLDFSNVRVPERPGKDWWLIIVAKGMTPERLFQKCRDQFGVWKWTDKNLDEIVTSDRTADNGHHAIWVRARVEADEEFKNLSANDLKTQNHNGITLEERLALELLYFWKTRKHLDNQSVTLCSGSRYSDGDVPRVDWYDDGEMGVGWYGPVDRVGGLRSRQVVSA
jgi:hypothetical protein